MKNQIREVIKNLYIRLKYYRLIGKRSNHPLDNSVVLIVDDGYHKRHPGLVDRFKVIIGVYYIAKINNRDFYLWYKTPFDLEEYLIPNTVDWHVEKEQFNNKISETRLLTYNANKEMPILNHKIKEYHCYFYTGLNILVRHHVENWEEEWHNLFWELFKPTEHTNNIVSESLPDEDFIAVHFRFANALDAFEKGHDNQLSEESKPQLIKRCLNALADIQKQHKEKICVFSDSSRFLNEAKKEGYFVLKGTENIGHVSYFSSKDVYDKTIVDFFAISKSKKVYAVRGDVLYNSVYPLYAAVVGGVDFEIYRLKS